MTYQDILFEARDGVATITINRPQVMNAFRGQTCEELIHALNRAGWDKSIGVARRKASSSFSGLPAPLL